MPHVSERRPDEDDDVKRPERTPGPDAKPEGKLGGQPVNADETAPREVVPDARGGSGPDRHPDAVDDEPGSDL